MNFNILILIQHDKHDDVWKRLIGRCLKKCFKLNESVVGQTKLKSMLKNVRQKTRSIKRLWGYGAIHLYKYMHEYEVIFKMTYFLKTKNIKKLLKGDILCLQMFFLNCYLNSEAFFLTYTLN